jgi:hypothetical protein
MALMGFDSVGFPPVHGHDLETQVMEEFGEVTNAATDVQRILENGLRPNLFEEAPDKILPGAGERYGRRSIEGKSRFHVYFDS